VSPTGTQRALHQSALQALLDGDPIRAEQLAGQALGHSPEAAVEEAMAFYGIQLMCIRQHEGRMGELTELIAQAATDAEANADPTVRAYQAALAYVHAQAGALDEAKPIFEELTADLDALRRDAAWSTAMVNLADTALVLHHADAAADLYERLAPFRRPDQRHHRTHLRRIDRPPPRLPRRLARRHRPLVTLTGTIRRSPIPALSDPW